MTKNCEKWKICSRKGLISLWMEVAPVCKFETINLEKLDQFHSMATKQQFAINFENPHLEVELLLSIRTQFPACGTFCLCASKHRKHHRLHISFKTISYIKKFEALYNLSNKAWFRGKRGTFQSQSSPPERYKRRQDIHPSGCSFCYGLNVN